MKKLSRDSNELIFRVLFSSIFLGLGGEHIFDDRLIQNLMPAALPIPRVFSVLAGLVLLTGGSMVLVGYRIRTAARILGAFLVVVTLTVHLPAVFLPCPPMPAESEWMWTILQRSNLVKNICLLGVCFLLNDHALGAYSVDRWRQPKA
ncbi:MAG: putative membrane protein YphA (DoxX/SURF4 family) [Myxococcota bacterium]